ncbi:MAG: type II secretion system protein N [Psychrobacter sp.]|nr:type II secretion system protein N [Psychrobacter sp.]
MASSFSAPLKPFLTWLNRLSGWLLLAAIFWLCWSMARLLWLILAPPLAPMLPIAPLQPAASAPTDYASSFMLFEQPASTTAPTKPPPNVTLKGVMLAVPEENSAALLEVDGKVKNYRVGTLLEGSDYKLIAVSWNEVILADPSDQQVVIALTKPMNLDQGQLAANGPAGTISNQRLGDNSLSSQAAMESANAQGSLATGGNAGNDNPQEAISEAVTELQQNPASYLSRMGVMATGEGYQVTAAMPDNLKGRLGLEPGDKVLSVNGQEVGRNPSADATLLDQVKQSGQAEIEVQRGDQVITIRQQF